ARPLDLPEIVDIGVILEVEPFRRNTRPENIQPYPRIQVATFNGRDKFLGDEPECFVVLLTVETAIEEQVVPIAAEIVLCPVGVEEIRIDAGRNVKDLLFVGDA